MELLGKIMVIEKIVIGSLVLVLFVFGAVVFVVVRSAKLEDYCTKYSQEKLGDRWYDNIAPSITKEEYFAQTGQDNFFDGAYTEASLGWFEVFKCENQHRNFVFDRLRIIAEPLVEYVFVRP